MSSLSNAGWSDTRRLRSVGTAGGFAAWPLRSVPEHERQVARVVHAGERAQAAAGPRTAGAPAEHAAFHLVNAHRGLAAVVGRAFLDAHVHLAAGGEIERADVDVAADEL